ncbi:hypothetical protein ACIBCT_05855 [Streptosporangium sp. NPDC050855]|uniref:hypothetical protein n=1 Tax=Streptosporangium sp. NPDC050855 TaxID=3366194 RepID=UPI00378CC574
MTDLRHTPETSETFRTPGTRRPARPAGTRGGMVRPVLWLLLAVSVVLNVVFSSTGTDVLAGIGFGLAAVACATALIVHHYRYLRR